MRLPHRAQHRPHPAPRRDRLEPDLLHALLRSRCSDARRGIRSPEERAGPQGPEGTAGIRADPRPARLRGGAQNGFRVGRRNEHHDLARAGGRFAGDQRADPAHPQTAAHRVRNAPRSHVGVGVRGDDRHAHPQQGKRRGGGPGIRTDGFQGGEHDGVMRDQEVGGAPSKARDHRRRGVERDEDRPHGSVGVAQQDPDVVPVGAVGERETLIERPQHVVHRDRGAAAHAGTSPRVPNKNAPISGAFRAVSIAGPLTPGPMATSILVGPPGLEPGTNRL